MNKFAERTNNLYNLLFLLIGLGQFIYAFLIDFIHGGKILDKRFVYLFLVYFTALYFYHKYYKSSFELKEKYMIFSLLFLGIYNIWSIYRFNFLIDYIFGVQIILFGGVLLLNSTKNIVIYNICFIVVLGFFYLLYQNNHLLVISILLSFSTIFFYSFYVQNSIIYNRKYLTELNGNLEGEVNVRLKEIQSKIETINIKNEELKEFAHVVSHDLKAPLRQVDALINFYLEDNKASLQNIDTSYLEQAKISLENMENLINGILSYSVLENDQSIIKENVDLNEVLDSLKKNSISNNSVSILVHPNLPSVYGNRTHLKQVFQNLLQNSITHGGKGLSEIEIGYSKLHKAIYVRDNGKGISESQAQSIFMPYNSSSKSEGNTGLGLSIVKKIIDHYHGSIWVESKENFFTIFYIKFN